jgi:peroxiredoxin
MVKTLSTMLDLGTSAPDFILPDVVSGQTISLNTFSGNKALLVMFICRHCPFVKHIQQEIARIGRDYRNKDVGIMAISSNDAESFPEDSPSSLKQMAEELDFRFPFCYDESQETAKAYAAACTPDFYLFNEAGFATHPFGAVPPRRVYFSGDFRKSTISTSSFSASSMPATSSKVTLVLASWS